MKRLLELSVVSACLGVASLAAAQEEDPEAAVAHRPPPAHRGFQMALRTGYALPFGKATGSSGGKMSDFVGGQVPLFIELGGKPIKHLFIGGYLGAAFGGVTGDAEDACESYEVDCDLAITTRLGVEVQYHILPDQDLNPWVGYGVGLESTSIAVTDGDENGNISNAGFEFARLSAGVDYRISRVFGVGPFADFSFGKYYSYQVDAPKFPDADGDIEDTAFHEWLTVGARFVFFP
jgi:hypothetical protein